MYVHGFRSGDTDTGYLSDATKANLIMNHASAARCWCTFLL